MVDEEKNGDVLPPNSGGVIDIQRMPPDIWRGILRRLNDHAQVATKLFRHHYRVELSDAQHIINNINTEFEHFESLNRTARVSLILTGGKRFDFSSWEEFQDFDPTISGKTKSLQIELTFDIVRKSSDVPERYSVQIALQNLSAPPVGFVFGNIAVTEVGEFTTPPAPIAATVRYVNYTLGKNILAAIDDWEQSLRRGDSKFILWAQKKSNLISKILLATSLISGVLAAGALCAYQDTIADTLTAFTLVWLIFGIIGYFGSEIFERGIDLIAPSSVICLTKGDERSNERRKRQNIFKGARALAMIALTVTQMGIGIWADEVKVFAENLIDSKE